MKKNIVIGFVCVLSALLTASVAAETVKTVVKDAQGRSGPGSYYELVLLIPENTTLEVLEKKSSWYKAEYAEKTVWVSGNSLSVEAVKESSSPVDPFRALTAEGVSIKATPATLTAAIKGFWTRYTGTDKENLVELPVNGFDVPVSYYETFVSRRSGAVSRERLHNRFNLDKTYKKAPVSYEKEHSIGYTIASSIADSPLLENSALNNYVYSVGWYIAESTERYDIRFTFYVLNTDRINAVSCPGGYIVLTRGLLELMHDESELAAILAHEMAHVIAGHAMQEMEDSKVSIQADSAFDLLGKETGSSETEAELIAIASRAVSIATSPKLDEQELEADRMALRYLARSGYDLNSLARMLSSMMNEHERNIDMFDLNYRNHPDFGKRIENLQRETRKYSNYNGQTFSGDFQKQMNF